MSSTSKVDPFVEVPPTVHTREKMPAPGEEPKEQSGPGAGTPASSVVSNVDDLVSVPLESPATYDTEEQMKDQRERKDLQLGTEKEDSPLEPSSSDGDFDDQCRGFPTGKSHVYAPCLLHGLNVFIVTGLICEHHRYS